MDVVTRKRYLREVRLNIIKQCVLRNEHFAPSTLPSRDRERLVTLRSTKQLLGRPGERFLLLGMLAHNKEGKLCIEDADGSVELDFSKLVMASLRTDVSHWLKESIRRKLRSR